MHAGGMGCIYYAGYEGAKGEGDLPAQARVNTPVVTPFDLFPQASRLGHVRAAGRQGRGHGCSGHSDVK